MPTPDPEAARAELQAARDDLQGAALHLGTAAVAIQDAQREQDEARARILAALGLLEGGEEPPPPPPPTEHFTSVGGLIRDPAGALFRPDGTNVAAADSYQWGDTRFHAHGQVAAYKARGYRALRLVHCYDCTRSHWPGSQHYGELDDLVAECTANGMVLIIDNHEGDLGGTPPSEADIQHAVDKLGGFAQRYGANPLVWYEPFNEPMDEGQTLNLNDWLRVHRPVCEAIRAHTGAPIVVCASMFGQDRSGFGGFHPEDSSLLNGVPVLQAEFGNIIGDLHGYHRWGGATTAADHRAYWAEARRRGVAILVGEFGAWGMHGEWDDEEHQASELLWTERPGYVGLLPWMAGPADFWARHDQVVLEPVVDDLEPGEEPPPPSGYPVPTISLVAGNTTLGVSITPPAELPDQYDYMVVAWGGPSGFIGSRSHVRPFPTLDTITGLANGTTYTVQVGYGDAPASVPPEYLATATGTPVGTTQPPPAGSFPRAGTIEDRRSWITARAGLADPSRLRLVGANNVPEGCQWVGSDATWPSLYVWDATLLEDLDIPARIVPRGTSGQDITLRNVRFYDAFTWEEGRIATVERCHSRGPGATVVSARAWGQGNLNALRGWWTVRGTILEGMADNIQQIGGGLLEDSILRNLVIYGPAGSGSHNDHVQNYGGLVTMRRVLVEQTVGSGQDSHVNSIFCDGGDYDMEDCLVLIMAPPGSNTWALHAAKGSNQITLRHTAVRGKWIGNVVMGEGADVSSPY
jgi:hypothetical protein